VLQSYPAYRIEDFYTKAYREGGVTYEQFLFLHKAADDQLYGRNRFMAAIHGIDIDTPAAEKPVGGPPRVATKRAGSKMLFGDPAEYTHLSEQERAELTQNMLKHWKPLGSKMLEPKKPEYHT